jgi:hypothetical protein
LAKEYREVSAEDASVKTAHPLSPTLTLDTLLTTEAAAQAEADRVLGLRKVRRDRYEVRVKLNDDAPQVVGLGDVIQLVHNRFGLSAGKLFRVTSLEYDLRRSILTLSVWG